MTTMKIDCPCCDGEIDARHTEGLSDTMRRMYFVCDDCGYRTPAGFEILFRCRRRPSRGPTSRSRFGHRRCCAAATTLARPSHSRGRHEVHHQMPALRRARYRAVD
jgi:hypothetical protein